MGIVGPHVVIALLESAFVSLDPEIVVGVAALGSGVLAFAIAPRAFRDCELLPARWPPGLGLIAAIIAGALGWQMLMGHVQATPEVRPTAAWEAGRVFYQAALVALVVVITATDLANYSIPTFLLRWGTALGILGAVVSGDLQVAHVWVDWNEAIDQIRGPYLPQWLKDHPHLHGLAWSLAGCLAGGGLVWLVRALSSLMLGEPAMGSGDVGLMAMIGAFVGWQPVAIAFLIAPLLAVLGALAAQLRGSARFLPYGPFLAAATLVVLFFWKAIWMYETALAPTAVRDDRLSTFAVRRLFGDPLLLAGLLGAILGGTLLLLGALRLYRTLPITRDKRQ